MRDKFFGSLRYGSKNLPCCVYTNSSTCTSTCSSSRGSSASECFAVGVEGTSIRRETTWNTRSRKVAEYEKAEGATCALLTRFDW